MDMGFETPCLPLDQDICNPAPGRPENQLAAAYWPLSTSSTSAEPC